MVGPTALDVPPTMTVKIFSAGVAACVADAITFPLDTVKVRLQVASEMSLGRCLRAEGGHLFCAPFWEWLWFNHSAGGAGGRLESVGLSRNWMR